MPEFELLFQFFLGAAVSVLFVLGVRTLLNRPRHGYDNSVLEFLIRDNEVIDANFSGGRLLETTSNGLTAMDRLRVFVAQTFENGQELLEPGHAGEIAPRSLQSRNGQVQAIRETIDGVVRLKVVSIENSEPTESDIHSQHVLQRELETLRANTSAAPFLLWRQNRDGEVTWVNQAYLDQARSMSSESELSWPLPVIFPSLKAVSGLAGSESRRLSIPKDGDTPDAWFDCHLSTIGDDVLCTAVPADEAVRLENRRREFTQTLTKTFAELAIGLAIFDRSRRLVLFNPALLDLTNLPTDFLTSRPSMIGFLDRLRENRVMPELRDYKGWRDSIAELEAAAVDGTYSETWSLPDGQTYHVTGRPHPDGALALLFEDISAEMSLTRHFRTELEHAQAVIDAFDDAVAVFSRAGEMTFSNVAYRTLWGIEAESFMIGDLTEATRRWHELSTPTPVWGDFREFAQSDEEREEWVAPVSLRDGRRIECRFLPQKGGATMVIFRMNEAKLLQGLQTAV